MPGLSGLPVIGEAIFSQNIFVYVAIALVPVFHFVLYRTHFGLNVRAVGENPAAADAAGINVNLVKYTCLIIGGIMTALGGAALTLGVTHLFLDGITGFRGWIAIAMVIFGGWDPKKIFLVSLIFGASETLVYSLQATQLIQAPAELIVTAFPADFLPFRIRGLWNRDYSLDFFNHPLNLCFIPGC